MRKTNPPTPMQRKVMGAIEEYRTKYRKSPTYDEIGAACHLSRARVQQHLIALGHKGLASNTPGIPRSLELTTEGLRALKEAEGAV